MEIKLGTKLKPKDRLTTIFSYPLQLRADEFWSAHVVGSPGEGKSTLLGNLAAQFQANGEGVLVVDPKGDLAEDVATRVPDTIYCAPGLLSDRFWSLNPLQIDHRHPQRKQITNIVAGNVVRLFEHLGRADYAFMTLIRTYMNAAVRLVLTEPEPTLLSVLLVLVSKAYRDELIERTRYPPNKLFWADFDEFTPRDQRQQTTSTKQRLWDFIWSPYLRNWVGTYETTFRILDWLDQGRMVICNFGAGLSETDAEALGSLVVSQLALEFRLRESGLVPFDRSRRFRVIVDEFHDLSPAPFARVITFGRSFNIFPVVAHQNMAQVESDKLRRAVKQSRVKVTLHGSSADRVDLSREEGAEAAEEVKQLAQHEARVEWRGPAGSQQSLIRLFDWWAARDERLLADAAARQAQAPLTRPESELPRLDDLVERWLGHGTSKGKRHEPTKSKAKRVQRVEPQADPSPAPAPDQPRPEPSQDLSAGADRRSDADPAGDRPISLSDQLASGAAAVPGPTGSQWQAKKCGERPAGGQ